MKFPIATCFIFSKLQHLKNYVKNLVILQSSIIFIYDHLRMNLKGCKRWKFQQSYNRVFAPQFATPIWKPSKTHFSTPKHDEHSHGVPGGYRLYYDIFELDHKCLQAIQPSMLLFIQFATPVHSALVFLFYLSNDKLGWDEVWSACQCRYHAPPKTIS